ncbi:MAG: LuxR C-terminal-related transcriptional regulator [Methylocella sp.]
MCLARVQTIEVVGLSSSSRALVGVGDLRPDVVLLDASLVDAFALPRRMREIAPTLKIVAFAISEIDHEVIAWAEAGISAYVVREGSAEDIVAAIHRALRGELVCSPHVAAVLFDHVAELATQNKPDPASALTAREREIVPMIERGLSNKAIARQLNVGTATVKNHVHNILEKLKIRRRGEVVIRIRSAVAFREPSSRSGRLSLTGRTAFNPSDQAK